jgi:PKD domain-containing protein
MKLRTIGFYAALTIISVISVVSRSQSITTSPLSITSICPGGTFDVSYTATGTFDEKNAFTVQLSDAAGSFTNFLNIGSLVKTTTSGTITAKVPLTAAAGSGYRVRVIGSMPYTVGTDNGGDLSVGVVPSSSFSISKNLLMMGDAVEFKNTAVAGVLYAWDFGDGAIPPTANGPGPILVTYTTPGSKTVSLTATAPSGCSSTRVQAAGSYNSINVYSCTPAIPKEAQVDSVTRNYGTGHGYIWVQSGITFITNTGEFVVFAEPGSSVSLPGTGGMTVYLREGASYTGGATGSHVIIHDPGASLNALRHETVFECSSLTFDYKDAPPNRFRPVEAVGDEAVVAGVRVYPMPASNMLYVDCGDGLKEVVLYNELGQDALRAAGGLTSKLQLNVSSLPPGTYYLRLSYANRADEHRKVVITR